MANFGLYGCYFWSDKDFYTKTAFYQLFEREMPHSFCNSGHRPCHIGHFPKTEDEYKLHVTVQRWLFTKILDLRPARRNKNISKWAAYTSCLKFYFCTLTNDKTTRAAVKVWWCLILSNSRRRRSRRRRSTRNLDSKGTTSFHEGEPIKTWSSLSYLV